jgi:hypothetical protein
MAARDMTDPDKFWRSELLWPARLTARILPAAHAGQSG